MEKCKIVILKTLAFTGGLVVGFLGLIMIGNMIFMYLLTKGIIND